LKALLKKIEAKILSSPQTYENLVIDKLIEAEKVIEVLPCEICAKKDDEIVL
jgi:hypothetical protein